MSSRLTSVSNDCLVSATSHRNVIVHICFVFMQSSRCVHHVSILMSVRHFDIIGSIVIIPLIMDDPGHKSPYWMWCVRCWFDYIYGKLLFTLYGCTMQPEHLYLFSVCFQAHGHRILIKLTNNKFTKYKFIQPVTFHCWAFHCFIPFSPYRRGI